MDRICLGDRVHFDRVSESFRRIFSLPTLDLASLRSISGVFETLHGFNIGQVGSVFATMTLVAVSHLCPSSTYSSRVDLVNILQKVVA
jgi:hypothetical protein